MNVYRLILILTVSILSSCSAMAQKDCGAGDEYVCASKSKWYEAKRTKIKVTTFGSTDYSDLMFEWPSKLDLMLEIEQGHGKTIEKGNVIVISGRLLLVKDLGFAEGYEIDYIDGPMIMYHLLVSLLDQAFKNGPNQVTGSHEILVKEMNQKIIVATQSADAVFFAPWKITGNAKRVNFEKISFDITFFYITGGGKNKLTLKGFWEKPEKNPTIKHDMKINEWNIYSLGTIKVRNDEGVIVDYEKGRKVLNINTLGELKKYVDMHKNR